MIILPRYPILDKYNNLTAVIASQTQSTPEILLILTASLTVSTATSIVTTPIIIILSIEVAMETLQRLVDGTATLTITGDECKEMRCHFALHDVFCASWGLGVLVNGDLPAFAAGGFLRLLEAARRPVAIGGVGALALGLAALVVLGAVRLLLADFKLHVAARGAAAAGNVAGSFVASAAG